MASVAQIQANRLNAQKSTGPRTSEGKERASRNAIKHGLLAREAVLQGEDPAEFEVYREEMLQELNPAGVVETMLAERVVGLSWRLRRAERLHNAAFATLDDEEPTELLEARHEEWKQIKGNAWDRGVTGVVDEDDTLGEVVVDDFAGARVLDRLLMYERRIESSLYRTMAQLRQERQARATATKPEEVPCSQDHLEAGQEFATPAELASFGAEPSPEAVSSLKCQVSSDDSDFTLQTSHFALEEKITPHGVTTNDERRATRPPDETLRTSNFKLTTSNSAEGRSCETNPIAGGRSACEEAIRGSIGGGKCGIVPWMDGAAGG